MHKKTARIILAGIAAFLLVLTAAGAASAISLEIDLPAYAVAGETVTGYVWIKDAGAAENNLSAYTVTLTPDPALINPHINYSAAYLDLSSKTGGGFDTNNPLFIAEAYGGNSYAISPVSEKLCTFSITIPSDADPGDSYTVGFNSTPQKTFLTTYTTYYDDGIVGHGSSHGTLAKAALTRVSDTVTVVSPSAYHNVTFYKEAGSVHTKSTVLDGNPVSAPANPEKEGYTFNGWNESSPSGPAYVFSTPVTADLDLYANWSANSYGITYIQPSAGGTISGTSAAACGSTVTVTATPSGGYEFVKLIVTKSGSSTAVTPSGNTFVMPAFAVNVTAQFKTTATPVPTRPSGGGDSQENSASTWLTGKMYSVCFIMNGHGTQVMNQSLSYGSVVAEPYPAPTADGYTFNGWYSDKYLTSKYVFSTPVTYDLNLYAGWTQTYLPSIPVKTPVPQASTPVPLIGILAGLGAAAVFFGLRRM